MRYIYDLDDVFCENKAHEAVKQEIINILKSSEEASLDIDELFSKARNNIYNSIRGQYLNNYYQSDNNLESENSVNLDNIIKNNIEGFNTIMRLKQQCDSILNNPLCNSSAMNETKKILEKLNKYEKELKFSSKLIEFNLSANLDNNSRIESIVFHKMDDGKYSVEEWIKPYLDRITFKSFSTSDLNIEGYDFTGTKGVCINSRKIKDNSLANTVLAGVTIECYEQANLYAIDPTKVDITGANFTGSKAAVVTLENVDELPENCNLTDAIIVVNSKDDITRLNLEEYEEKVYIKQDSIIVNDEIIDIDFNNYFNYTGIIDDIKIDSINESLKLDGANNEDIRVENNKIISYLIASELASIIDFDKLYSYFDLIKKGNDYIKEHPEMLEERRKILSDVEKNKKTIISSINENLYEMYKKIGNPIYESCKYVYGDDKFKIFTSHGILTIDLLRLGLPKEKLELVSIGEEDVELGDSTEKVIINLFNTMYSCVSELESEEAKTNQSDENTFSLKNIVYDLCSDYNKRANFRDHCISSLQDIIYNSLEENNKGYHYAIKK